VLCQKSARFEKGFKNNENENPHGDFVGVITVEVPEGIPIKPLKED
jgi:hypothetical protein